MGEVVAQTDLAAWLLACIEEDEQAAKNCGGAPWVDQVPGMVHVDPVAIREAKWQFGQMGYVATVEHDYDRVHIARWDPARVLVECDTKRRIIEQHASREVASLDRETWAQVFQVCRTCCVNDRQVVAPCPTLRLYGAVYKHRDGYREEWEVA